MRYFSTRDNRRANAATLTEAAFAGLAPDGGLYMPESIPTADMEKVRRLGDGTFDEMASYVAGLLFGEDVDKRRLEAIVHDAFDFEIPMVTVGEGLETLQLFHGPTFAFKDVGARFMGRMIGHLNSGNGQLVVLTATSGDTGSAVARGFWHVDGVKVVVLYPEGKVSPIQEAQMATLGDNIIPVSVDGCFDDCQRLVKEMFVDKELREKVRITSANSINILRWMPQSFYYFHGWSKWVKAHPSEGNPDIVVPSGNYGNLAAGMLAWRMGMPVRRFIAAANANDVVPEFLETGVYRPRPSVATVANAMDVGAPSNFERMVALCDGSGDALRQLLSGCSFTDDMIREAIAQMWKDYGYVSDPHSATGYLAARRYGVRGFWLSTAHPAKFPDVVEGSTGVVPSVPAAFAGILDLPRNSMRMEASGDALRDLLKSLA